jgi:hypothetical protein
MGNCSTRVCYCCGGNKEVNGMILDHDENL